MIHTCGDRPLLGALLLQQGDISGDDVDRALEAQTERCERLGEILVELGLLCRPALDRALASQSGVELPEESGFGSGLRAEIERRYRARRDLEAFLRVA
jgi:hypothetical protein